MSESRESSEVLVLFARPLRLYIKIASRFTSHSRLNHIPGGFTATVVGSCKRPSVAAGERLRRRDA